MVPVEVENVVFTQGYMHLMEGRDDHIIEALRESVNNKGFKNRYSTDKAIYEEVDVDAEMQKDVEATDLIVEAYTALKLAAHEEVIEYAKALGLGVGKLGINKKGEVNDKKNFERLITEMKSVAKKDPKAFVHNFTNPLRPFLALISDGILHQVITYDYTGNQYSWLQGVNKTPIVQVPKGVNDEKDWFAAWLRENSATSTELTSRVDIARKM